MDNCRQFCGFCQLGNNQQVLTGFFGRCYYNGKSYTQGQTWDDGCSYECTCDDASAGRYSCYNKCPIYFNLPPQCTLVKKSGCCLEPVCDFKGTHLSTNGQQTGTYQGVSVCMYKSMPYYQGQTWQDGCDKSCYCQDAEVGLYTCQSVCAHYGALPSECTLQRQAGKCCEEPVCTFNKQYGQFTGSGTLSGKGTGASGVTTVGPCVDKDPNCSRYPPGTCTDANYIQWAKDQCQKSCNFCPSANPTPGPNDVCIYNGVSYHQGQRWDDGCELECVCENAAYGFYRCQKKCADIVNLPLGCTQVKNVGDCCPKVTCTGTTGTFTGSQTVGGTIGGNPVPQPMPGMNITSNPGTSITGSLNGCLYKGALYQAGQRWDDGCDYSCVCEDGSKGQYKCTPKCPTFSALPTGCTMQDNPNDPCCRQAVCAPGTTTTSGQPVVIVPTYGKGFTGFGQPVMPQIGTGTSGMNPTPVPGSGMTGAPISGTGSGCVYNGRVYRQGETWDQGCQYKCECVDASAGQYRCVDRCTVYTNLPAQCTLQTDPNDNCCKTVHCDFNLKITTLAPIFAQTTPVAGAAFCKYQGYYHRQGEEWNDGCGLRCRCEDATNHYYQCTDRCPKYDNVPSTCTFVVDPKDPQCCRVPQCQNAGGNVGTSGFTGSFTGYGHPVNILPSQISNTGYSNKCLYKGQVYAQGATWQDGCDFECECVDASKGMYRCNERCTRIASVPTGCTFAQDPNDACCQKLRCDAAAQLGTCMDNVNCASYGTYVCGTNYKEWAQNNCAKYCGYCGGGTGTGGTMIGTGTGTGTGTGGTMIGTGTGGCVDKLTNCAEYSQEACTGLYVDWARDNCAHFCNLCMVNGTSGGMSGYQTVPPGAGGFTGFSGGCVYKGRYYGAGDKWTDGCDYNCTCENGQTGFYRCSDRCPSYQLPAGCVLKTQTGECCGVPDCTGATGTGDIQLTFKDNVICLQKNGKCLFCSFVPHVFLINHLQTMLCSFRIC
ncbi:SAS-like protein [Mya arenaria]|uniref:SAS-like protein n=1 Tax=Mya arenaria TaxID=6604 RepID=A0ABY7EWZ9_MYAAR|nr:SAS-like protein [Mya arenaria]